MSLLYRVGRVLLNFFLRLYYRIEYHGVENIPADRKGGYIVACNHRSIIDPMIIAKYIPAQIFYMAKAELFEKPFLHTVLPMLGAFPVDRGKGDMGAVEHAIDLLHHGKVLGIFPEGTRSVDGTLGKPKSGTSVIASKTGADILPIGVIVPVKKTFRSRVVVAYGKLIPHEELVIENDSPAQIRQVTKRIWGEITALVEENR